MNRSRVPVESYVLAVVRERLSRPDLADLLAPDQSNEATGLNEDAARLRSRLAQVGDDYDAGLIDGQRFKIATEKIRAELAEAGSTLARLTSGAGAASILLAPDPVAAFDGAALMIRRCVLDALCVVRLTSAPPAACLVSGDEVLAADKTFARFGRAASGCGTARQGGVEDVRLPSSPQFGRPV